MGFTLGWDNSVSSLNVVGPVSITGGPTTITGGIVLTGGMTTPAGAGNGIGLGGQGTPAGGYLAGRVQASGEIRSAYAAISEATLTAGVDPVAGGNVLEVTLTAARLVANPLSQPAGDRLTFIIIQGGAGGFAVTWGANFKVTWSDVGNTTGKRTTISFVSDGVSWNQDGAQTAYV